LGIQNNIAAILRAKKKNDGRSLAEWSAELGVACSTLQEYMKGEGNPTVIMVEHLAEKMGISPVALVAGDMEPEQYETALLMLDTIQAVSVLPQPKRVRFAELFLELMLLWEE